MLQSDLEARGKEVSTLELEKQTLAQQLTGLRESAADLESEKRVLREQAKEKGAVLDQLLAELVEVELKLHEARADRGAIEETLKQAEVRIEEQSGRLLEGKEEVAERERRVASLDSERDDLGRRAGALQERASGLESEKRVLLADLEARGKAASTLGLEKQALAKQLTGLRESAADLESEKRALQSDLEARGKAASTLGLEKQALAKQLAGLRESAADLESEKRALQSDLEGARQSGFDARFGEAGLGQATRRTSGERRGSGVGKASASE